MGVMPTSSRRRGLPWRPESARLLRAFGSAAGASVVAAVVAVLVRAAFVHEPPSPDEGGYLVVASRWDDGGPFSYGRLFVDRPPVLLLVYRLASMLGGLAPLRWIGCVCVVVAVAAAGWAGCQLASRRGARWAAALTAALMTTPMLDAHEVDGELIAAPLVLLSCACLLRAHRRPGGWQPIAFAAGAGLAATLAVLVKQNFVDGLAFAAVVFGVAAVSRQVPPRQLAGPVAGFVAGILLPIGVVLGWAWAAGPGVSSLLYAMFGFRSEASQVLLSYSFAAPGRRLYDLAAVAATSGILMVAVLFVTGAVRSLRAPVVLGVAAMFVTSTVGVVVGLSYWSHYLIQLVPAAALAVAWMARGPGRLTQVARVAVVYAALVSLVSTGHALLGTPWSTTRATDAAVDTWISTSSRPHDSVLVTYGHADLIYETGLTPAGSFIWTLPLRTLDPQLHRLIGVVEGKAAPVWILDWSGFDTWGLDAAGRLDRAVLHHYRPVESVCGVRVFLHDGVHRPTPAPPSCPE